MPRGGARVGAGRPKGSMGKAPAAKADKSRRPRLEQPRPSRPAGASGAASSVSEGGRTFRRDKNGDDDPETRDGVSRRSFRETRDTNDRGRFSHRAPRGKRTRTSSFVDDLAAVAAEEDDADDAFSFRRETTRKDDSRMDEEHEKKGSVSAEDRLEAAARLAELRSRWELAEVLAFLTAFRRELRAGARRATKALGLRETHWAAAAPSAAELERALADPEGKLAFPGEPGFPAESGDGGESEFVKTAPLHSSVDEPGTRVETETARRRAKKKRAATLARTHLSLLFGLEPETHVSDKPPAGGWSKRWPEWTARVSGDRVAELFGARERNAPFDRSAFETTVEEDVPSRETPPGENGGATRRAEIKKKPRRGRRVVARRSAAEAYAAITPTRRVRALWGLCEARLACDDIRERLSRDFLRGVDSRTAGAARVAVAEAGDAYWYVGRRQSDDDHDSENGDDPETRSGSVCARDVLCGVARVCRAAPPRWDVYADEKLEKRLEDPRATAGETLSRDRSDPISDPISSSDTKEATRCSVSVSVAGLNPAPSRGALEYAERAVWADAASAEADAAERWAFVLEEAPRPNAPASRSGGDGSGSDETDALSDLDSPSPKRRRRRPAGTKPPRAHRRETVETRFARRARCDPADVIYSLASEGVWAEARKSEKRETNRAARKVAEKAPVEEKGGDASDSKNANRIQTEFKKKPGPGPRRRDVPPYHRFAASFVSAPPLVPAAEADARAAIAAEADAMVRLDDIPCAWCGDGSGESAFVLCDGCPNGGHLACLGLRGVPKNRWVCAVCADGGEGAGAPRSRVIRRPAHLKCVAANAANSGFGNQNRPRAPREGAWVTVAEERALWESPAATDRFDARWRGATSTIKTHASFARDAFERASARRREATRHAAAAARVERAALDARRAERLARRDDDVSCDDDDEDDDWDGDDTGDDTDRSEGARYARPLVSESDAGELGALHSGGDGTRTGATARRRDSGDSGDSDDSGDFLRRGRTMSSIRRGRPGPTLAILTWTDEKAHEQMPRLCARCGDACFPDADRSSNRPRGSAFAKCAFCPAEGHRACVFGDALDACAVCARKTSRSRDGPDPRPAVRAPPSPVARRAFPRRVPTRVRRALESDVDDAWRFE